MSEDIRENDEIAVPEDLQFEGIQEESDKPIASPVSPEGDLDHGRIEENENVDGLKIVRMDGAFPLEAMLAIFTIETEDGEQRVGIPGMYEYVHERFVHLSGKPASDRLNDKVVEYVRNKTNKGEKEAG